MVRQDKSRPGRVTPKTDDLEKVGPSGVSRNPVKIGGGRVQATVPFLMFGLMGLGLIVIVLNYVVTALGAPSNWYLLLGLGMILGGIVAATQYR
ncbi:MAG: cell division protein CrgA [Acidimicrobiales bacterium]